MFFPTALRKILIVLIRIQRGVPVSHIVAATLICLIQSTYDYYFFRMDLSIKNALFFSQVGRRQLGRAVADGPDTFSKWYGTIVPHNIPDSTAWWRRQARELGAICDDTECGLMQSMVTITHAGSAGASCIRMFMAVFDLYLHCRLTVALAQ